MKDIHASLIQADDGKIFLFPAWPSGYDVEFKLYTLEQTSIEVKYLGGEVTYISVLPAERYDDVEVMNGASLPANGTISETRNTSLLSDASITFKHGSSGAGICIAPLTNAKWTVQLVAPNGRLIMETLPQRGNAVINAGMLPAGMYFCIVRLGAVSIVKQLPVIGR
jgi:hypothetical protein